MKTSSDGEIAGILRSAHEQELLGDADTLVICVDLAIINDRLNRLLRCFPDGALHAIPIKTNPLSYILKHTVSTGMGLEAASLGEVYLAVNAGIDSEKLVFDSPAKTPSELAILKDICPGARLNADSLEELQLYRKKNSGFRLGIRINPLVDANSMVSMNVGTEHSKFGVSLTLYREIIAACCEWKDVDCLHLHIGSQIPSIEPMVIAVMKVLSLADDVNESAGYQKIRYLDIGGGFPVNYNSAKPYRIEEYAAALVDQCSQLFSGKFKLITEFGRYVYANSAWAASRVEFVKTTTNCQTLITHSGADLFLRECYNPDDWYHDILILDAEHKRKAGPEKSTWISGPLCFGGDFIARNRLLPQTSKGDTVVVRDVGANTFALWSRHCSRPFPKVLAYDSTIPGWGLHLAKDRESYHDIASFWS